MADTPRWVRVIEPDLKGYGWLAKRTERIRPPGYVEVEWEGLKGLRWVAPPVVEQYLREMSQYSGWVVVAVRGKKGGRWRWQW